MARERKGKLDALAGEAAQNDPPAATQEPGFVDVQSPVPQEPTRDDMANICRMPVIALAAAVTSRCGVPALNSEEVGQIAASLAMVLQAHGVGPKDPRIVAWLTLGGAVAMAAQPRMELYIAQRAREVEAANDPKPQPQADAVAA
jgi:hypothetical protein